MATSVYRIRKALRVPLVLDSILLFTLILLAFFVKGTMPEKVLLIVLFIPLSYLCLEANTRRAETQGGNLRLTRLFRKRELAWPNITDVGIVIMRTKVYAVLTTTKGFHVLSNSYEDFYGLLKHIVDHVEKERVEKEVLNLLENPVENRTNILSAWAAAAFFCVIIFFKLFMN
ncbi:MAG TPA: hypothetical protein P5551_10645 [Syntrophales bacterium]|jgi:hypothetical protein|nr:hypothetical protein [Syntrophales bacterium]HRT62807.1 hypothetical protein [Syntrophales bacterium]